MERFASQLLFLSHNAQYSTVEYSTVRKRNLPTQLPSFNSGPATAVLLRPEGKKERKKKKIKNEKETNSFAEGRRAEPGKVAGKTIKSHSHPRKTRRAVPWLLPARRPFSGRPFARHPDVPRNADAIHLSPAPQESLCACIMNDSCVALGGARGFLLSSVRT